MTHSILLRSRLPAFRPTDREPRIGYSSLAVLNSHKHRIETNGASTDSVAKADVAQEFIATRIAREIFETSKDILGSFI